MTNYMLDTNIVSHIIKGDLPQVRKRLQEVPIHGVAISAMTHGELIYGLAKRQHPPNLSARVHEFLIRVEILPWTPEVAYVYGDLRASCEAAGVCLAPLDMLIAAHAKAVKMVLVTGDRAFARIPDGPVLENWIQ